MILRPWQIEPANRLIEILKHHDSALDSSDTGTGKTYVAVAIAQALDVPTLAIVPKIAITGWLEVGKYFNETFSIINYESLRTGNTPFGSWANQAAVNSGRPFVFICQCCQRRFTEQELKRDCFAHPEGIHCVDRKPRPIAYGDFKFHSAIRFVIFDEVHRCGGRDSLNAEMLIAAKRQRIKHLMLSATPAQSILQMRALGYSLDLHNNKADTINKPNFYRWLAKHGARRDPMFHGWHWPVSAVKQREVMAGIRSQMRGVRVKTDSIPGFPEVDIQTQLYDIENSNSIDRVYSEMESALSELATRQETDIAPESAITIQLRCRQKIELLEVPAVAEIVRDKIECGFSVVIFCEFRATVIELSKRLDCGFVDGTVTGEEREAIIAAFQKNESRTLVVNSAACGIAIGLQDLDGNYPRFGLVFPGYSATVLKQVFGRLPRDGGRSKSHYRIIIAAGTLQERVKKILDQKMSNLDALLDSDLSCVEQKNLPL